MEMNRRNTKKDFYSYKADLQKIPEFEHNDLINDWLIEHVCRFNETAGYLLRSLQKVSAYGKLLSEEKRFVVQDPPFRKRISHILCFIVFAPSPHGIQNGIQTFS